MLSFFSRSKYIRPNEKPTFTMRSNPTTNMFDGEGSKIMSSQHFYATGKKTLRWTRIIVLVMLLILFAVYLYFSLSAPSETFKLYFHAPVVSGPSSKGPFKSDSMLLTEYNIWIVGIVYMSLAILFQIYPILADDYINFSDDTSSNTETVSLKDPSSNNDIKLEPFKYGSTNEDYYAGILLYGMNWYSWVESAFVMTVILWTVFQFCGVTNVIILVSISIVHVIMTIGGGYSHEATNSAMTMYSRFRACVAGSDIKNNEKIVDISIINWLPYIIGLLGPHLLIIFAGLITYFAVMTANGTPQWINYTSMIFTLVLLFVAEGVVVILFYGFLLKKKCNTINRLVDETTSGTTDGKSYGSYFSSNSVYFYEKLMIVHNKNYELAKIIMNAIISMIFVIMLTIYTRHK